jgi:hypothetical protein
LGRLLGRATPTMRTTRKPDPPSIAYSTSAQECVDRGALGGATDQKVAPMRPVSGIEHARHDTPCAAASKHTITAGRPVLPNVASPVAADEARDLGASGGPGQAP